MGQDILDDLKVFLCEVDRVKLSPRAGFIPRKKCVEINEHLLKKDIVNEFDVAMLGEESFFHICLLRALAHNINILDFDEKNWCLVVKDSEGFFSKDDASQLDDLFFAFFVETDWSDLTSHPPRFSEILKGRSEKIAKWLLENAENEIKTEDLMESVFGEELKEETEVLKDFMITAFEETVLKAMEYFGAAQFKLLPVEGSKRKVPSNIRITELGKTLLTNVTHSPRHQEKVNSAMSELVKLPLVSILKPTTDIPKLRKLQAQGEEFFQKYKPYFLCIESAILNEYYKQEDIGDRDVLEALLNIRDKMGEEKNISMLESSIRAIIKINVGMQKIKNEIASLSRPELKAIVARIIHWVKNHSDEGKNSYLEFLDNFMQGKLETPEQMAKYLAKSRYLN